VRVESDDPAVAGTTAVPEERPGRGITGPGAHGALGDTVAFVAALADRLAGQATVSLGPRQPDAEIDVELRAGPPSGPPGDPGTAIVDVMGVEHGTVPAAWVGPARDVAQEIWVPSLWARDAALSAGLPAGQVTVVRAGVDTARFTPEGPSRTPTRPGAVRFLHLGGFDEQSGVDALLEAYLTGVRPSGDIRLVLALRHGERRRLGASFDREVRRAAANTAGIELVDDIADGDLPSLYRSCDALVHVARADGDARSVLEAMSCGLPVITQAIGPGSELVDAACGWIVDARVRRGPELAESAARSVPRWIEPERTSLAAAIVAASSAPEELKRRGVQARARAEASFDWSHVAEAAAARITAICSGS
jgi:glycosyltransferase involved in cell wall biosynthesis